MTFFVIKHLPTGGYLPERHGKSGRGYTFSEPSTELPPRLFTSESAAKRALTYWLKGRYCRSAGYDSYDGEYYEDIDIDPQAHRIPADMTVVEVELFPIVRLKWNAASRAA